MPTLRAPRATLHAPAKSDGVAPRLILIIEDDPDSRTELHLLLEEQGYSVLRAPDGRTGLRLAEAHGPDLIIQDLLLPDTHGFDLVGQLRALPTVGQLPIIALLAFPDRPSEARASALGFNSFMRKPPAVAELCRVVSELLSRR